MKRWIAIIFCLLACLSLCACGGPKDVTDFECSATIGSIEYSGLYSGTIEDRVPNGSGVFTVSDNNNTFSYSGTWNNGVSTGVAELKSSTYPLVYNNATYIGQYSGDAFDGTPSGTGSFSYYRGEDYIEYSGEWINGQLSGIGYLKTNLYVVHFPEPSPVDRVGEYKGDTLDGLASGTGTFSAINGEGNPYMYTGSWVNGLYHGLGTFSYTDEDFWYESNFENGNAVPTPRQLMVMLGNEHPEDKYYLSENAGIFMDKYPEVFLDPETMYHYDIAFNNNFNHYAFAKNPNDFGSELIVVSNLEVIQIFEYVLFDTPVTFCLASSDETFYFCYYLGTASDVFEGSTITLTALPLDYFTYSTVDAKKNYAVACAAVYISNQN